MRQPGTRAKRAVPIATQPLTPPQPRPQHTTLGPRVSVLRICSTQLCLPSIGRSHFCVSFVSSGSEVLCVVFFNLFVFIFGGGGYLINLLLSDTPPWCWRFLFIWGVGPRGLRRDRWNLGQGRSPLSPQRVAETGLCLEPAGVSRPSPQGAPGSDGGEMGLVWKKHQLRAPVRLSHDLETTPSPTGDAPSRAFLWLTCALCVRGRKAEIQGRGRKGGLQHPLGKCVLKGWGLRGRGWGGRGLVVATAPRRRLAGSDGGPFAP